MKSASPQILEALEQRIADDKATSQETAKTDDKLAEQMNDTTQAQYIPKVSAPEICLII